MIELFGMSSPNVTKVVILLEELGQPYVTRHVEVFRGGQFESAFAAISPFGKVPAIRDSDTGATMFESVAILIYLAETYGGAALLPASGTGRYAVLQWLVAQAAAVGPLLGQKNHFMLFPDQAGSYAARRYDEQARRIYGVLETRLRAAPFLAGETYTLADIATYPWALYLGQHGFDPGDHPALTAWCAKLAARPAMAAAQLRAQTFGKEDVASMRAAKPEELDRFFWRQAPGPAPVFFADSEGR